MRKGKQPQSLTVLPVLDEGSEIIKQRILDLLEMLVASLQATDMPLQQRLMLNTMGPLVVTILGKIEAWKLAKLLHCLQEISQAVNNLDYSQETYEAVIEPVINEMGQVF